MDLSPMKLMCLCRCAGARFSKVLGWGGEVDTEDARKSSNRYCKNIPAGPQGMMTGASPFPLPLCLIGSTGHANNLSLDHGNVPAG